MPGLSPECWPEPSSPLVLFPCNAHTTTSEFFPEEAVLPILLHVWPPPPLVQYCGDSARRLTAPFRLRQYTMWHEAPRDSLRGVRSVMWQNVTVKNFRCFSGLFLEPLARVNLIAGKNNTGKTALLEAIHLHNHPADCQLPVTINKARGIKK